MTCPFFLLPSIFCVADRGAHACWPAPGPRPLCIFFGEVTFPFFLLPSLFGGPERGACACWPGPARAWRGGRVSGAQGMRLRGAARGRPVASSPRAASLGQAGTGPPKCSGRRRRALECWQAAGPCPEWGSRPAAA